MLGLVQPVAKSTRVTEAETNQDFEESLFPILTQFTSAGNSSFLSIFRFLNDHGIGGTWICQELSAQVDTVHETVTPKGRSRVWGRGDS